MNNETIQSLRNYALADKAKTTPRTDAATIPFDAKGCERDDRVPVSFARQLERELQQATADNSSLAERLTAAELERDRLGAELEELQGSHDLNQIASDALNDLRAALARVTAELEHHKSVKETIDSAHKELSREHAAIRARVAELDKEAMILRGTVDAVTTQRQQAEQRNAELVAALDAVTHWAETIEVVHAHPFLNNGPIVRARGALARAKSATPAKQEVSR